MPIFTVANEFLLADFVFIFCRRNFNIFLSRLKFGICCQQVQRLG